MKTENIIPKTSHSPQEEEALKSLANEQKFYEDGFCEGKRLALLSVLKMFHAGKTLATLRKELEHAHKVLQRASSIAEIKGIPEEECLWEKGGFVWEAAELERYVEISIDDLRFRLEKARSIYLAQRTVLAAMSQVTIDDLIKKE